MKTLRFLSLLAVWSSLLLPFVFAQNDPDAPHPPPAPVAPAATAAPQAPVAEPEVERTAEAASRKPEKRSKRKERIIFKWGHEAVLPAGQEADSVGAIFGPVSVEGNVRENLWSVFGPISLTGSAHGDVVAVLGSVYVDGPVDGCVISVLGGVKLGPNAYVTGDVTSVGGQIEEDPAAVVENGVIEVAAFGRDWSLPRNFQTWLEHAFLMGRPLALHRDVTWAWCVAGAFLGLYLLLALIMNESLQRCAQTLEQRPGKTVLATFLTVLLIPLLLVVLAVTVVGTPLLLLAILVASFIGKAAFLCWLGRRLTLAIGLRHAAPAVLVGGLILCGFYVVPILGFAMMKITDVIGLGMVVYTVILVTRREKVATPAAKSGAATSGFTAPTPMSLGQGQAMVAPAVLGFEKPLVENETPAPVAVPAIAMARAGLGIRIAALGIDLLLIMALNQPFGSDIPWVILCGVYLLLLWGLKGTTIGGIVCGIKIVRRDGGAFTWSTAVVRLLAGFLSALPAGFGFFWIAFDEESQAWHDKIAGTLVVHAPKGSSLV
jgi:uncharacterized RDD family membrane protein YckC